MDRRDYGLPSWLKEDHDRGILMLRNYEPGDVCECPQGHHDADSDWSRETHHPDCPASKPEAWIEWIEIPAIYEVCPTCNGKGSHVNPSIDRHGISMEEFYGPDWDDTDREMYMTGGYDVPCVLCHGRRVTLTANPNADPALLKMLDDRMSDEYEWRRECEAERRMGA